MENDKINWNITGQNNKKRKFVIPVGNLSKKEAEKSIKKLMDEYKKDVDLRLPVVDTTNDTNYFTDEDIWNELTTDEKKERLLSKEEQDEKFRKSGFIDWNQFDLDYLADYLEKKWMYMSSGEALAICKLIDFYREHKDKI